MPDKQDQSIGELFSELASETGMLIRQEVALAKSELTEKAKRLGRNIGGLLVGGAIAYAALLALLAAIILLLSDVLPAWAAALIVAVVVGAASAVLISKALSALRRADLTPRQTVETLKENAQWAKQQAK